MLKFAVSILILFLSPSVLSNSIGQLQTDLEHKQYSKAVKTGQQLLDQQPDNILVKFLTAVAFQHNNQIDSAKQYYHQIINSHPELPEPRNNLAMILMNQGHYDQAIELLITSMKTHPAYATAWQNLNLLYRGLASEAYRKALSKEKNPHSVMDKVQLSALTTLYDVRESPVIPPQPVKNIPLTGSVSIVEKKPAPEPEIAKKTDPVKSLQDWATAWSQKDFEKYIDAYTYNFKGGKSSHQQWLDYRRSRILRQGSISVKLSNFQIKSRGQSKVVIDFQQNFKSPTYRDKVIKRVHLTKTGNNWKITREITIAVL